MKVFWSWQSDTPGKTGRHFVRDALAEAVARLRQPADSVEERRLVGFYLLEGRLLAAVGLDRGGDPELDPDSEMAACARLVGKRARPAPECLADEAVDLWSLLD